MSKLKVSGNASGTGVITLEAPNTNTDRTITLPDGDISLGVGIDDNATSTAITIDASENVDLKRDLTITSYDPQKIKFNRQTTSLLVDASVGRIEMYSNDVSGGGTGIASYIDARTPSNGTTFDLIFGTKNYGTDATEKMRILSSGGISFNGDTAAANALDDYEEGTWTPTTNSDATGAFSYAYGHYVKIGRVVTAHARISISANFTGANFGGLPFTVNHLSSGGSGNQSLALAKDDVGDHCVLASDGSTLLNTRIISGNAGYLPISGKTWRFTITYTTNS